MTIKKKSERTKIEVDLTGPEGNAFSLLGLAAHVSKRVGHSEDRRKSIQAEMMSGDYEQLVAVFDREFGDIVDLLR